MEIKNGILVKPKEYIIRDNEGTPIYIASSKEVGGVIVFIVFFFLIVAVLIQNNRPSIRKAKAEEAKNRLKRIGKEEKEYRQKLMADPYINIESDKYLGIHQNRLREHRASAYQGRIYYLGKKGGLYYRSSTGTRIYL